MYRFNLNRCLLQDDMQNENRCDIHIQYLNCFCHKSLIKSFDNIGKYITVQIQYTKGNLISKPT